MRYTDKEYKEALIELQDQISALQTSEQIVYQGGLDKALSNTDNYITEEIERYKED
jgi:spore coat protein CotH